MSEPMKPSEDAIAAAVKVLVHETGECHGPMSKALQAAYAIDFAAHQQAMQAAQAEVEQLKGLLEPGTAPAIVEGMFELAEEYGHSPFSSRHALTFFREQLQQLTEQRAEVERLRHDRIEISQAAQRDANEQRAEIDRLKENLKLAEYHFDRLDAETTQQLAGQRAAMDGLVEALEWKPIETAPKDGSKILTNVEATDLIDVQWYDTKYEEWVPSFSKPTHWRELEANTALAAAGAPQEKD